MQNIFEGLSDLWPPWGRGWTGFCLPLHLLVMRCRWLVVPRSLQLEAPPAPGWPVPSEETKHGRRDIDNTSISVALLGVVQSSLVDFVRRSRVIAPSTCCCFLRVCYAPEICSGVMPWAPPGPLRVPELLRIFGSDFEHVLFLPRRPYLDSPAAWQNCWLAHSMVAVGGHLGYVVSAAGLPSDSHLLHSTCAGSVTLVREKRDQRLKIPWRPQFRFPVIFNVTKAATARLALLAERHPSSSSVLRNQLLVSPIANPTACLWLPCFVSAS